MTPREIIALATHSHTCDGEYSLVGYPAADATIQVLAGAGYSIIHDSENHGPTVERAAGIADEAHDEAQEYGTPVWANVLATDIRAMKGDTK